MKTMKRSLAALLSCAIVLGIVGTIFVINVIADSTNNWVNAQLGALSLQYETSSTNDSGIIATVSGDAGGKSYGLYMFASKVGNGGTTATPYLFMEWLRSSSNTLYQSFGEYLYSAYYTGGAGYGANFDAAWKNIAASSNSSFMQAQTDFVQSQFYDKLVSAIESKYAGFYMDTYSIALKNVFWSRAVQHGVAGATTVIDNAFASLGGFANQAESQLITAIYKESGAIVDGKSNIISLTSEVAKKYNIAGKSMKYFYGCSSDIQLGVYTRLNINEPADAQVMLASNGYKNVLYGLYDGDYQISIKSLSVPLTAMNASTVRATSGQGITSTIHLTYYASQKYALSVTVDNTEYRIQANGADAEVTLATPSAAASQLWTITSTDEGYIFTSCKDGYGSLYCAKDDNGAYTGVLKTGASGTGMDCKLTSTGFSTNGTCYPSENNYLVQGSSAFPIRGMVYSATPITKVMITVTDSKGNYVAGTPQQAYPNTTSYNLGYMDQNVQISKLDAGTYQFKILISNSDVTDYELVSTTFTVYPAVSVTVSFDATTNGGSISSGNSSATYTVGGMYGSLPTATKADSDFSGWYTEATGGSRVVENTVVSANVKTLYAHFDGKYTYTFKNYDGSIIATDSLAADSLIPTPYNASNYQANGIYYTFSGWKSGGITFVAGETLMPASDIVFEPVYTETTLTTEGGDTGGTTDGTTGGTTGSTTPVGTLSSISPNSSVSGVLSSLGASAIYASDGVTPVSSGYVGTGMLAKIGSNLYTLVVTGDVNGDGLVNITDAVLIRSHVLGKSSLTGCYATAADLNSDNTINITDAVQSTAIVLGR